jgi:processive 1,2-diacylglycerol beta-glucosyltransferase
MTSVSISGETTGQLLPGSARPRRILFVSANYTGHGHRSISESLKSKILEQSPDAQVEIVDGFALGGWLMKQFSRLYNPIVAYFPALWGLCYRSANHLKRPICGVVKLFIRNNLYKKVSAMEPDVIVSVHAAFVTPVIDILASKSLDIPVISLVADLDNITDLWVDARAHKILCPSRESLEHCLRKNAPEERLMQTGFPVRQEFCSVKDVSQTILPDAHSANAKNMTGSGKSELSVLIIYGSQGSKSIGKIILDLLEKLPCRITIITGNNKNLKTYLERSLKNYSDRIAVLGFTKEIKKYMQAADLLILRASPNVLMEAINLAKPLVIIGALRGQEEKNPEFVVRYGLGIDCQDKTRLTAKIESLLADNRSGLEHIRQSQLRFRNLNASAEIASYIQSVRLVRIESEQA